MPEGKVVCSIGVPQYKKTKLFEVNCHGVKFLGVGGVSPSDLEGGL